MEEQFRPKETVGGSSPSRGTLVMSRDSVDSYEEPGHRPGSLLGLRQHLLSVSMVWVLRISQVLRLVAASTSMRAGWPVWFEIIEDACFVRANEGVDPLTGHATCAGGFAQPPCCV